MNQRRNNKHHKKGPRDGASAKQSPTKSPTKLEPPHAPAADAPQKEARKRVVEAPPPSKHAERKARGAVAIAAAALAAKEAEAGEAAGSAKSPPSSEPASTLKEAESERIPQTVRAPFPTAPSNVTATKGTTSKLDARPAGPVASRATPSVDDEDGPSTDREPEVVMAPPPPLSSEDMRAQLKDLEKDIDRELERASQPRLTEAIPLPTPSSALLAEAEGVFATARELLSTDYYLRRWGRLAMRNRSEEVDDFGFDPVYEAKLKSVFDFLYEKYFRVDATGLEHIPDDGRCLLVANHSGTLPADGLMIKLAVKRGHPNARDVRWLAEDFLFHFPFLGSISNRIGAVRACQENAERLLRQDALVAVFPEGVKGIGKLYRDRYRLQRFGRGGFIKLALRTRTPIVPVGIVGGEETNPLLYRLEGLGKAFGFPYVPITPTFPLLGPAGLAPLPTKWKLVFGNRLDFADYDDDAADDEMLVSRLTERVRASIQELVDGSLSSRQSIWFG